jgi:hypothetical protein
MHATFIVLSGVLCLAFVGCGSTGTSRAIVSKSTPGKGVADSGKIKQVNYDAKEAVILEADREETKTGWSLGNLNPFNRKKERIPLPLSKSEPDEKSERSAGGF